MTRLGPLPLAAVIAILSLVLRVGVAATPAVFDRFPGQVYDRVIHYQVAAAQWADGNTPEINLDQRQRILDRWRETGNRLPPDAATVPALPTDRSVAFYDERGYLLWTRAIAWMTGRLTYWDVLLVQSLVSSLLNGALVAAAWTRLGPAAAIGVALAVVAQPLELIVTLMPDLPVIAVWGTLASGALLLWKPAEHARVAPWVGIAGTGLILGFAVASRAPSAAIALAAVLGLVLAGGIRDWPKALVLGVVTALTAAALAAVPTGLPGVGRSEFWHTLLGGLAEFGDIPDLIWNDEALDAYIEARHDLKIGDPGYGEAAKTEYFAVIRDRPWLLIQVPLTRLGWFIWCLRPTRDGALWVLGMGVIKVGALLTWVAWVRSGAAESRRVALAILGVGLGSLVAHLPIVPLLEVYVAPTLITMMILAVAGPVAAATTRIGLNPVVERA